MADEDQVRAARRRPNVLVTGTPGVGKTATATLIAEKLGMKHVSPGEIARERKLYDGRDEQLDTNFLDEDALLDIMEGILEEAAEEEEVGVVVDFHMPDLFPERWFDLILVLRTQTDILFDRLTKRGYPEAKRTANMEAEIMQVILDEAREAYDTNIVHEIPSNTRDDLESNVERVAQWIADNNAS